jgi:hypothetical protein
MLQGIVRPRDQAKFFTVITILRENTSEPTSDNFVCVQVERRAISPVKFGAKEGGSFFCGVDCDIYFFEVARHQVLAIHSFINSSDKLNF